MRRFPAFCMRAHDPLSYHKMGDSFANALHNLWVFIHFYQCNGR